MINQSEAMMTKCWLPTTASALFLLGGACAVNTGQSSARAVSAPAGPESTQPSAANILAWSKPAAGSTVGAPMDELVLHLSPPARLQEVTVTGPDGTMPMMVTAAGEATHYSLPVTGLGPGRYTVAWRASRGGFGHRGSFGFAVE